MSKLIKNILLIDGSGKKGKYPAHIAIKGDKIERIFTADDKYDCNAINENHYDKVIDGYGLYATPGFIDTHGHSDLKLFEEPCLLAKSMQGVTSEFIGQDGTAVAPLPEEYIESWRQYLSSMDGVSDKLNWHFHTLQNYRKEIAKAKPSINIAVMAPHGNLRMATRGLNSGSVSAAEMKKMQAILEEDLKSGGFGFSTGLAYIPCVYSDTEELIDLASVLPKYEGVFVTHQRSESNEILASMQEILRVCRENNCRTHFSHFKLAGKHNFHKIDKMLELLDQAAEEGLKVSFDQYPYVFGSTILSVILPPWSLDGGTEHLMKLLEAKEQRQKIIHDIINGLPNWEGFCRSLGIENIAIANLDGEKNQELIGLNLVELGKFKEKDPYTAALDLLYEEKAKVSILTKNYTEDLMQKLMLRPEMNLCTDGLYGKQPHPRVYSSFPRFLYKYVRQEHLFTWEQAIYKMTGKAAEVFQIPKRGFLREGYFADIVLLDPTRIQDRSSIDDPKQYPDGIEYVFVNGESIVASAKHTGKRPGTVLTR